MENQVACVAESLFYDKSTAGRNTIYVTKVKLPDTTQVLFDYGDPTTVDLNMARVGQVRVGVTDLVTYRYRGSGHLVGTTYEEPDVFSNRHGTTSGDYGDLDRFDRVEDFEWTRDLATDRDFYDVDVAYDRNSNITRVEDNVHTASGNGRFDVLYTIDNLNRLTRAKEGHWDGSTITDGNATRDELWTLEQTGNWELNKVDLDGDLNYNEAGELNDDRTHNVVNELTARDTDDNGSDNYTLTFNARGDMTDDGKNYTYQYDGFGRLRKARNRANAALVAEYKYNGKGERIGWHYDVDGDGSVEDSTDDPWFQFTYDDRWRIVNTYRLVAWTYDASNPASTSPKERFVYHYAGLGGGGGSSYIDSVILRDKDANTAWGSASDGVLEERRYYCQNFYEAGPVKRGGVGIGRSTLLSGLSGPLERSPVPNQQCGNAHSGERCS